MSTWASNVESRVHVAVRVSVGFRLQAARPLDDFNGLCREEAFSKGHRVVPANPDTLSDSIITASVSLQNWLHPILQSRDLQTALVALGCPVPALDLLDQTAPKPGASSDFVTSAGRSAPYIMCPLLKLANLCGPQSRANCNFCIPDLPSMQCCNIDHR